MLGSKVSRIVLPVAMALFFAPLAFGKLPREVSAKGKMATDMIVFSHPTVVNGITLQPGEYRAIAKENELTMENMNHKVVATSFITWGEGDHTFRKTKLDIDHKVLTKIDLGGTREEVVLHGWQPSKSS